MCERSAAVEFPVEFYDGLELPFDLPEEDQPLQQEEEQQHEQQEEQQEQPLQGGEVQPEEEEEDEEHQQQEEVQGQQREEGEQQVEEEHEQQQQYEEVYIQSQVLVHAQLPLQLGEDEEEQEQEQQPQEEQQQEDVPHQHQHEAAQQQHVLDDFNTVHSSVVHAQKVSAAAASNVNDLSDQIESHQNSVQELKVLLRRSSRMVVDLRLKKTAAEELQVESREMLAELQREELAMFNQYPFLQYFAVMDAEMDSTMMEL